MQRLSLKNVGPPSTHQEIKRLRREAGDMLRRYGQPVAYYRAYNLNDTFGVNADAKRCPACYDDAYAQSRADCEVCFGTTLVSTENDPDHWIDAQGYLTEDVTAIPAPAFGGYREPVLTRVMQPDMATDVFRINEQGVLIKTQDASAVAYWTPLMEDNDLLIDVTVAIDNATVIDQGQRYLTKMVNPISIRGWGKRTHDQSYTVGQSFQMNTLPLENIFYRIPLPVGYGEI